jgi:hypothetical protein
LSPTPLAAATIVIVIVIAIRNVSGRHHCHCTANTDLRCNVTINNAATTFNLCRRQQHCSSCD